MIPSNANLIVLLVLHTWRGRKWQWVAGVVIPLQH
jgi:hypothetical protein